MVLPVSVFPSPEMLSVTCANAFRSIAPSRIALPVVALMAAQIVGVDHRSGLSGRDEAEDRNDRQESLHPFLYRTPRELNRSSSPWCIVDPIVTGGRARGARELRVR